MKPLLLLCIWMTLSAPVRAMLVELPLDHITKRSTHVVQGTVLGLESHWTEDNQTIVTLVTLGVDRQFKGEAFKDATVQVRVLGGEVGDIGIHVEHEPRFLPDERVLVFLEPDGDAMRVYGDEQGKFTVADSYVVNSLHPPVSLADFQQRVQQFVAQEDRR